MEHPSHPVESHWRTSLRNRIIQASSLLEVLLSGLVLIGLLLSVVPLIRWMPGLLFDGNEAEIRTFLERSLDIVIGIEFIKMLDMVVPGFAANETLLYSPELKFYSNKVKSIADIPEGAVISVPNDPTNCGRGLLLLQAAGLIKLPEGMGSEASLADIVENKRNLKIRELEAAQLPRSLDDALVAVIPMNYVISAGLSPQKQGFYFESLEAPFALIIIAAHQDRRNDKSVQDFVKYYRSPEVKAFVEKTFNGTIKPSW